MGLLRKRGTGETEKFRESVGREPKLWSFMEGNGLGDKRNVGEEEG